ncbi:MAG TPA: serine/threonine-protein kinase [Vicinamibacterales bacterium]|nr:serine/threonine-protein kinase [Vicinamibacterales bacterium]
MTARDWDRVKDLFGQALEREPAGRGAFLRDACRDDEAMRAELESLLAAYDANPSASAAANDAPWPDDLAPGDRIDRYRIVRRIGAGGMGAVYLAVRADEAYDKRVAIKVVAPAVLVPELVARFDGERRILAALEHPNIARLLDGGTTERGAPYLVMDYVEGVRLDEYCDGRRLPVSSRVRLFVDVCAAVQYVHQHLIVHRDLKPGNVLVTADGVPKLLDFGIAKLLHAPGPGQAADVTRLEQRVMTPRYASPEQIRGEPVTTASDVYALGIVLYELLTGRRPHDVAPDASPLEMARAIGEQEPERPSTAARRAAAGGAGADASGIAERRGTTPARLHRRLRGDLDTIVLKALASDPRRRYGSAEQLADDLRRHLTQLPITAHPESWRYRAAKFAARHRAGVAAAAVVVLSLVAGVAATSWQARLARAERARAERRFDDVRRLTTSFLFEFHAAIRDLPGATPARRLLVQRAREYLERLAGEAAGDRPLQRELAEAYLKVGDVQGNPYAANLGDTEGAARSYGDARRISAALVAADGTDTAARRYLARSDRALGEVLPQLGRPSEAAAYFREAAALLESLLAASPADRDLREQLAGCYQVLGDLQGHGGLQNLGDLAGALASYRRSLSLYRELAEDRSDKGARRGVALVQIRIGDMAEFRDELRAALDAYRDALAIATSIASEDPTNAEDRRRLALAHRKVGGIEEDLGQSDDALREYENAAAINRALVDADPANVQASMGYAISLRYSGDLLASLGRLRAALARDRAVLGILERLSAAEPASVTVRQRYSEILVTTGRLTARSGAREEARRLTARGLALARQLAAAPEATPDDLDQYALGFLTCEPPDLRDPAAALKYAEGAVRRAGSPDSDKLDILAQAYVAAGQVARGIDAEERALRLLAPADPGRPSPPRRRQFEARLAAFQAMRAPAARPAAK